MFFRKKDSKPSTDELSKFKEQKLSPSHLKELGLDKPISNGMKCTHCSKVFHKFSEVYSDFMKAKIPCCPYCKSNVMETVMIPKDQIHNDKES